MARTADPAGVRLSELIASLSLGTDLGLGQPMEHVQRQCLIALRLGQRIGLAEEERECLYYAGLLAWIGCHVDAFEQARWFGDDLRAKGDARLVDFKSLRHDARYTLAHLGAGRPALQRVGVGLRFAAGGYRDLEEMLGNHCVATDALAESLGLGEGVRTCVRQAFERWDGRGPFGLRGDELLVTARLIALADVVQAYHRAGGVEPAVAVARERSGTQFDPSLVDEFTAAASSLFDELDSVTTWDAIIDAEPPLRRMLADADLERALEAVADFTDLKSPYTLGHSRRVGDLAGAASTLLGLPEDERQLVRRAGLVHDLGRLGVSNAVWDKRGGLSSSEWERVRLHPYLTERMLASAPALARLGSVAAHHHERLDGSGYPRGLRGDALSPTARVLAVADAYAAMSEPRPHREPVEAQEIASVLRADVRAGRLDGGAVDAVLGAAGHRVPRRQDWPAGLTAREVEVLRLVARGLSNREIAERLVISRKTAGNHVEHVYAKAGVRNRAQASLFAIRHGLVSDTQAVAT